METIEQKNPKLLNFRAEIAELKRAEEEKGEAAHFNLIEPDELTERDMEIFYKLKNGELTPEMLKAYQKSIPQADLPRHTFGAYIANMLMINLYK
jgi:uncharacterized coiled-coil DUF342 family protein